MAPPEKKQRTEEQAPDEKEEEKKAEKPEAPDAEMKDAETKEAKDEKKEPEPPKELEQDAPMDKAKPRIKDAIKFLVPDTTLNVMPSANGSMLMCLTDGGIQHLYAGARANVGVKSGRYMFEVKIVEYMSPGEDSHGRAPRPKNTLRVGFSTAGSSLIMGDTSEGAVCFDSEGAFVQYKRRAPAAEKFTRDDIITVLLNLDDKSPNCNTISLFKDGARISQPQPLPDVLKGQTLYPTVAFKNMSVHVNFGMEPLAPLPFRCRMMQDISQKDATVTTYPVSKDGKSEVLFPVSLPDEGTFQWLDMFHEKNPGYTELSDRMILDWAQKSGIWRSKGYKAKTSNDKPDMSFGIRELDDNSVRRVIYQVAPLQSRNFIVMEVKSNLIKGDRKDLLARFPNAFFKKVGVVMVGEPTVDFKKRTNELVLKQKQEQSDAEFKAKKAEEQRKKLMEKRQKELEKAKKKAEKAQKKAAKEMKRKLEEQKKAAEEAKKAKEDKKDEEEKKEGEDVSMEEKKPEEDGKAEEEKKEEEEEEDEDEEEEEQEEEPEKEEPEEEPPKVQLTSDEKKILFPKTAVPDVTPYVLSTLLTQISLPDKEEGFDEIKYEWNKSHLKATEHVKQWIMDKKLTTRVEDLTPSDWFGKKWAEWQKVLQQWHAKHNEYKAAVAKKEAAKAAKAAKKNAPVPMPKKEPAKKDGEEGKDAEAAPMDEDKEDKGKDTGKEEKKEEEEKEEEEEEQVDFATLDIFGITDVTNIGGGVPLFKEFQFEDWTMMSLRFELHLLAHAFRHDVDDNERAGIHLDHLGYYYNKYFKKSLSTKYYGVETFKELLDLVNDAVYVSKKLVMESQLEAEMECLQIFVKLTEEERRYRNLQLALGEESAKLKLSQPSFSYLQGSMQRSGKRSGKDGWYGGGGGGSGAANAKGGGRALPSYGAGSSYHRYGAPQQPQAPRGAAPRTVRPPPSYGRPCWGTGKGRGK